MCMVSGGGRDHQPPKNEMANENIGRDSNHVYGFGGAMICVVNSDDGYEVGLAALQFFASPGLAQVASWHKVEQQAVPWFFHERGPQDRAACYFYGVGCIFIAYASSLYDRYGAIRNDPDSMDLGSLGYFHGFLGEAGTKDETSWSEAAVLEQGNRMWDGLRLYARGAIQELREIVPEEAPSFYIENLISPDDFRTGDDVEMP